MMTTDTGERHMRPTLSAHIEGERGEREEREERREGRERAVATEEGR